MEDLKWEQYDLDVLVKENNEPTIVNILSLDDKEISNKFIKIELRDSNNILYGKLELSELVDIETLGKVLLALNTECEIRKQNQINEYIPKEKIVTL